MSEVEKYGKFIDAERCFELVNDPPKKWMNLNYNKPSEHEIYAETSPYGDGPITMRDNIGNVCELVSYDCRYIYIRDDQSNLVFNVWGEPVATEVQNRSWKVYPWMSVASSECDGLSLSQRVFCPQDEAVELTTMTVKNLSNRTRKVSLFDLVKFELSGKNAESKNVYKDNVGFVKPELQGVLVINRNVKVPTDRYKGFVVAQQHYKAANAYRDHFTRVDFSLSTPKILWGFNCDNRDGFGPDCAGIVQCSFELKAGQSTRVDFIVGQAANEDEIRAIKARLTPEKIDAACEEKKQIETKRASSFTVDTGHPNLDALMNHFAKKQMVSYLINKSGFRDNLQTDAALAMCDYKLAEANLLRALSSQYPTGSVPHGFRPMNRLQYSDKPGWIFVAVPALVKESGDLSFLQKELPYFESDEKGSVWDHMIRAMRFMANDTGKNGLCDQHFADWNDGLEPSDKTGARESIMVTQQLCHGLLEMEELAQKLGDKAIEKEARDFYDIFKKRLNESAWDGKWYIRSTCEVGTPLGTHLDDQASIFLNTQSWAILSRTAEGERAEQCMKSVDEHLETDIGFLVSAPPCTRFDERIGRYSGIMPGHATNGGAYCHAAGFKAVADCMMGRAEEAWRTLLKTAPDSPWNPLSNSATEPFSFTNCYEAVPCVKGKSVYPWRTGTVAWFTMALIEWMLGVRRSYDGLLIDPCLSKEVKEANLERYFRGAVYQIHIDNKAGLSRGTRSITVDGSKLEGNILPVFKSGVHKVEVLI